jgi:hypothetical protein
LFISTEYAWEGNERNVTWVPTEARVINLRQPWEDSSVIAMPVELLTFSSIGS